jgi:hypothetical protein
VTTYNRSDRRHWRHTLRRIIWRVNLLLAALAVAVLLASPTPAAAQTKWDRCWRIPHGSVCVNQAQRVTRITCDWGYQPQFGRINRCVAMAAQS